VRQSPVQLEAATRDKPRLRGVQQLDFAIGLYQIAVLGDAFPRAVRPALNAGTNQTLGLRAGARQPALDQQLIDAHHGPQRALRRVMDQYR
jgi:hypothetical protein